MSQVCVKQAPRKTFIGSFGAFIQAKQKRKKENKMNEIKKETNTGSFLAVLGVMAAFLVSQNAFIINPALSSLAAEYPNMPYSSILLLSTIVTLFAMPFSIIGGIVVGKKAKYKTICCLATILVFAGGLAPYFVKPYTAVLVLRIVVGIGTGLMVPLGNALVMRLYTGQKQANLLGLGTSVMNIAGIVYQIIAGIVCAVSVNYTWLLYLFMIIPFFLMLFFLPEPEKIVTQTAEAHGKKTKLPITVYIVSLAYGTLFMMYYPLLLNMSAIVEGEGLGTAALAGTILSMYSIGGMIAGFAFGLVMKALGRKWTIPVCLVIHVLALGICYYAKSPVILMAGVIVTGITIFTIWPAVMTDFTATLPQESVAGAGGIFSAVLSFGGFLASPFVGVVQSLTGVMNPRMPILAGTIGAIGLACVWIFTKVAKIKNQSA
jgi:MFS family permease